MLRDTERLLGRVLGWSSGVESPLLTLLVDIWILPTSCRIGSSPVVFLVGKFVITVSPIVESLTLVISLVVRSTSWSIRLA